MTTDLSRRLTSVQRLLGDAGLAHLQRAHIVVVGIGGVGSWAVEALARSGVGQLTLLDFDQIAESNINRQVHALDTTVGAAKVTVMRERIAHINPACLVHAQEEHAHVERLAQQIPPDAQVVIDACDAAPVKAALIAQCRDRKQKIVVCGAAGGHWDPLSLAADDLARVQGDALLASVRNRLRKQYGYASGAANLGQKQNKAVATFNVTAIYCRLTAGAQSAGSVSPMSLSAVPNSAEIADNAQAGGAPLNCAGYGSMVTVTGAMGFAAAARAMHMVLQAAKRAKQMNTSEASA